MDRGTGDPPRTPPTSAHGRGDVLVVEDEVVPRSVMETVLTHSGYGVTAVGNVEAALAAVAEHPYGAIVCDIRMPGKDGVDFYRALEGQHPHLAERVVFVTAVESAPGVSEFLQQTGRPVLRKPYAIRALVDAVAQLVRRPPSPGAMI